MVHVCTISDEQERGLVKMLEGPSFPSVNDYDSYDEGFADGMQVTLDAFGLCVRYDPDAGETVIARRNP